MSNDIFQFSFLLGVFGVMLRITSPILMSAMGVLIASKSGILDLSGEGIMLMGALSAFLATYFSGSLLLGCIAGVVIGLITSSLFGFMTVILKMDQSVSGIAINLLSSGVSFFGFRAFFESGNDIPSVITFSTLPIPILSKIPVLGEVFFSQNLLTYIAYLSVPLVWFFLYKTKYGLILRFTGENPRTVDTKGINVNLVQFLSILFSGLMNGLAGAFLPLVSTGLFLPNITSGRGFIALSLIIFGYYVPKSILIGALFFGFLLTINLQIQGLGIKFPYQLLNATPYIFTILALIVRRREAGSPSSLGVPYRRE